MKHSPGRRSLIALALTLSGLSMLPGGPGALTTAAQSQRAERAFEDKLPAHIPVKVKVNNLQSPRWPRELEIEVRNTGHKPIYYLSIFMLTDVLAPDGRPLGFAFKYGRVEMASTEAMPTPEDVPIEPGGSHIFKIEEKFARPWVDREASPDSSRKPKKFSMMLAAVFFGDGTGFQDTGGTPMPYRRASGAWCEPGRLPGAAITRAKDSPRRSRIGSDYLPVSFLPANFLPDEAASPARSAAELMRDGFCCVGSGCYNQKVYRNGYTCACGESDFVRTVPCGEPGSQCGGSVGSWSYECFDEFGNTLYCPVFYIQPCQTEATW